MTPESARRDPYETLGLRGNPFTHAALLAVAPLSRAGVPDAPPPGGSRMFVEVIGVRGAGKSTLLAACRALRPGEYHWVPPDRGRWKQPPVSPQLYWDEVDRMPTVVRRLSFRRAARASATLVVGTHQSVAAEAERAGFTTVTSLTLPALTLDEVRAWTQTCIEQVSFRDPPMAIDDPVLAEAIATAGSSWRVAADLLHVHVAQLARERFRQPAATSRNASGLNASARSTATFTS